MVTTPQSLSAMIVRKTVHMAQDMSVPIVGVVENMSYFVCPDNKKRYDIFGPSHAEEVAGLAGAPVIARQPIDPEVTALCDAGKVESARLDGIPAMLQAFLQAVPV